MRVWDLGQQRCVSSYAVHDGAVWALAMDPAFTAATTGGRDGCIYRWAAAAWVPFGSYQPHPCKIRYELSKVTKKIFSESSIKLFCAAVAFSCRDSGHNLYLSLLPVDKAAPFPTPCTA